MLYKLKGLFWKNLRRSHLYGISLLGINTPRIDLLAQEPWQGNIECGESILVGDLNIKNHRFTSIDILIAIEKPQQTNEILSAYMQSFMFLYDLNTVSGNAGRKRARQLIEHWIRAHHSWTHMSWNSFSWKPGIVGLRLFSWLSLYDFYASTADEDFKRLLITSFDKQLRYLKRHWSEEKDELHRFWALKSIVVAESLKNDKKSRERLEYYMGLLSQLIQNQILSDGGHANRSPLLHWRFLRDLIDIRTNLRSRFKSDNEQHESEKNVQNYIQKMTPILRLLRHGDGGLASFDESLSKFTQGLCLNVKADSVDAVLTLTDAETSRPPQRAPESGYERCTSRHSVVLINTFPSQAIPLIQTDEVYNEPGIEFLNIEWSLGRHRLINKGDLVIQSNENEHKKKFVMNLDPNQVQLVIKRHNKEGHNYIAFDVEYVGSDFSFYWKRHIYLSQNGEELSGYDTLRTSLDSTIGIRFELNPFFIIEGEGERIYLTLQMDSGINQEKQSIKIKEQIQSKPPLKNKRQTKIEPERWFFRSVGSDEVLTSQLNEETRTLLLMKKCEGHRTHTIKWSFSQTNSANEI